jgi:hypothetical protein
MDSTSDVGEENASASCLIDTSRYEQSCSIDSDCITEVPVRDTMFPVQSGNYCESMCLCGSGVISAAGEMQYLADLSQTPLGSGAVSPAFCLCSFALPIGLCVNGTCTVALSIPAGDR